MRARCVTKQQQKQRDVPLRHCNHVGTAVALSAAWAPVLNISSANAHITFIQNSNCGCITGWGVCFTSETEDEPNVNNADEETNEDQGRSACGGSFGGDGVD